MAAQSHTGPVYACSRHDDPQETLNARSEYTDEDPDGRSHHHINQYVIKDEIGRGSYGAVSLATDQYGNEYVRLPPPPVTLKKSH